VTRARWILFFCVILGGSLRPTDSGASTDTLLPPKRLTAVLVVTPGVAFEDVDRSPEFQSLGEGGGIGLLTTRIGGGLTDPESAYRTLTDGAVPASSTAPGLIDLLRRYGLTICSGVGLYRPASLPCEGSGTDVFVVLDARYMVTTPWRTAAAYALFWRRSLPEHSLVIVASPQPSPTMDRVGDEVTPVVVSIDPLATPSGPVRALRSDTTRQDGLVANVDVAPTILDFFGIPIPKEMTGSPIRIGGTADVAHLHRLHLDQRRIRLPLQLGEVAFISLLFILTIASVIRMRLGRGLPPMATATMRFLILCAVALMIPLMAGGLLPRLTYAVVVPFVVLSTVALAVVALKARWPGPMGPFAFLGAVGLSFMVIDGLFGWRGLRIPLLGATMFDGARYYGIPNAFLATLLGSSLFVATVLQPWAGTVLLFGAGLFAGFPALGADLGGSATLFLAAGLWWATRTTNRGRAARTLAVPVLAAAGVALVLLANRFLPGAPTHITGFVERTGGGLSGVWHAFTRRLDVGVGQLRDVPAGWLPMLGLPAVLAAAVLRPEPFRSGLAVAGTVWRGALIVLTLAAIASFFANDTGVAAAAPAFLYAATALSYPVFLWAPAR
jgi:hypothetical protein